MSEADDERMIAEESMAIHREMVRKGEPMPLKDVENGLRALLGIPSPELKKARAVAVEVRTKLTQLQDQLGSQKS